MSNDRFDALRTLVARYEAELAAKPIGGSLSEGREWIRQMRALYEELSNLEFEDLRALLAERDALRLQLDSGPRCQCSDDEVCALVRERDALQAEVLEQARCNGMGSEREARIMAERDEARRERDALKADAELLDWANDHVLAIEHFCDVDGSYAWEVTADRPGEFVGKTPCEAIDAARNAEEKE